MIAAGALLGPYAIRGLLAHGGMATLYRAERQTSNGRREVALKVVHPHLTEDEGVVRMLGEEARIASRVHHPNIVAVDGFGTEGGQFFLALEYVHGWSLSAILRSLAERHRRIHPDVAVYVAAQVAAGLNAAHELRGVDGQPMRVVHRDVTPRNILLGRDGRVKLTDFGIARARGRVARTRTGAVRGTLRYLTPEQAASAELDRRTDIYALSMVLWEMLAGRRFLDADGEASLLFQARCPEVVPPSRYAPDVSPQLDAAVLSGLSLNPSDRPATARAFAEALFAAAPNAFRLDESRLSSFLCDVAPEEEAPAPSEATRTEVVSIDRLVTSIDPDPRAGAGEEDAVTIVGDTRVADAAAWARLTTPMQGSDASEEEATRFVSERYAAYVDPNHASTRVGPDPRLITPATDGDEGTQMLSEDDLLDVFSVSAVDVEILLDEDLAS